MSAVNSAEIIGSCLECTLREGRRFCNLALGSLEAFEAIKCPTLFPRHAVLFAEGQPARGVFVLCSGRAKLSTHLTKDRKLTVLIAEPGEVLGLSAAISGQPYEVTAETLDSCQVNFVKKEDFLRLMSGSPDVCMHVVEQLNSYYYGAHEQVRSLAIPQTAAQRLAKLILKWCAESGEDLEMGRCFKLALTHEEIAQTIGTSRETVTRLLSDFKNRQLLHAKGSTLIVRDVTALEAIACPSLNSQRSPQHVE